MSQAKVHAPAAPLTGMQWLVCVIAAIGFAFDIYELLMGPLITRPAIAALSGAAPGDPDWAAPVGKYFIQWARTLIFVPAIAGGVFGLLGGYLTDRLGRRRVLTWSILMYAFGAFAAGFSMNLYQLLFCRCLVFIGVCVEFVAAVAWLAELFPNPEQREKVLGYTQAFSSLGGVMVAGMYMLASRYYNELPAIQGEHAPWRYTLISGLIPAIPLILIRPFLPESPAWLAKKEAGTLKRPSFRELFGPQLRKTTILTTLAFATTFGIAFGALQQNQQVLSKHIDLDKAGATAKEKALAENKDKAPKEKEKAVREAVGAAREVIIGKMESAREYGGLVGRVLLAILAVQIVSRRKLFALFQLPGLLVVAGLYWWIGKNAGTEGTLQYFQYGVFLAGLLVVGQMSFWGNYIPLVFPVHLRGTGEGFAANIGGRVLGTAGGWFTLTLIPYMPGGPEAKAGMAAAVVGGAYALLGAIITPFLPEPLPETEE